MSEGPSGESDIDANLSQNRDNKADSDRLLRF